MTSAEFEKYCNAIRDKVGDNAELGILRGLLWTALVMERPDIASYLLTRYGERAAQGLDPHQGKDDADAQNNV